jgi:hypothetical protein
MKLDAIPISAGLLAIAAAIYFQPNTVHRYSVLTHEPYLQVFDAKTGIIHLKPSNMLNWFSIDFRKKYEEGPQNVNWDIVP